VLDTKAVRALADRCNDAADSVVENLSGPHGLSLDETKLVLGMRDFFNEVQTMLRQCADRIDAKDGIIKQQGELIERIRLERDALREILDDAPLDEVSDRAWCDRVDKALGRE
jgi:hypothetical protein